MAWSDPAERCSQTEPGHREYTEGMPAPACYSEMGTRVCPVFIFFIQGDASAHWAKETIWGWESTLKSPGTLKLRAAMWEFTAWASSSFQNSQTQVSSAELLTQRQPEIPASILSYWLMSQFSVVFHNGGLEKHCCPLPPLPLLLQAGKLSMLFATYAESIFPSRCFWALSRFCHCPFHTSL